MGQLEEEKMQVCIRLGIWLCAQGMLLHSTFITHFVTHFDSARLLKPLSIQPGIQYNAPEPAIFFLSWLPPLEHRWDPGPLDFFSTYLVSLCPSQVPTIAIPETSDKLFFRFILVSIHSTQSARLGASRSKAANSLLLDSSIMAGRKYTGGALAIFQLAPQDYHHFHSPIDYVHD